jgi:hypothetical protein
MRSMLRAYRRAVHNVIAEAHAAGMPVYQGRDGYLVAIYPDGVIKKLKPLDLMPETVKSHGKPVSASLGRAQRQRKDDAGLRTLRTGAVGKD